jgi:hypothetical protein
MTVLAQAIGRAKHSPGEFQMREMGEMAEVTRQMLARVEKALEPLSVPVTKATLRDALEHIEPRISFLGCGQLLLNVQGTLARELESTKLFALDAARCAFYDPTEPLFGVEVNTKFPSVVKDIADGGRAYACDLPTAAAFHWIRCLEAGARAVARSLQIPDPTKGKDRNWGNLNKSIADAIDAKWPRSTGRMAGDAKLFDEVLGALGAMANPYRNATMHFDASYTAGEAMHIFELVKGVMQRVASRIDEQGMPLA